LASRWRSAARCFGSSNLNPEMMNRGGRGDRGEAELQIKSHA
jgi:hypothetical protein